MTTYNIHQGIMPYMSYKHAWLQIVNEHTDYINKPGKFVHKYMPNRCLTLSKYSFIFLSI